VGSKSAFYALGRQLCCPPKAKTIMFVHKDWAIWVTKVEISTAGITAKFYVDSDM
jgi:hypothetical protein